MTAKPFESALQRIFSPSFRCRW